MIHIIKVTPGDRGGLDRVEWYDSDDRATIHHDEFDAHLAADRGRNYCGCRNCLCCAMARRDLVNAIRKLPFYD